MNFLGEKREEKGEKYSCIICDYNTSDKAKYTRHLTTRKHADAAKKGEKREKREKKEKQKGEEHKYSCLICEFITNDKTKYNNHMTTFKHKNNELQNTLLNKSQIVDNTSSDKEMYYMLLKDNQNFKQMMVDEFKQMVIEQSTLIMEQSNMMLEQNKQMLEFSRCNNAVITTNNNNIINNNTINNNHKFNLNFFLNEQCKDAMNLSDFVDSIDVSLQDLEYVGEYGYVNGITKIIMDNLNQLDLYKRPIHCTDLKREVIHIKDNDKWEKDTEDNEKMKKFIASVGRKNSNMVYPWQLKNPEYEILDSPKYNQWLRLAMRSNEYSKEEKNHEAILRNITKKIYLDKKELQIYTPTKA
jgi:hypothetical protein